MKKTNRLLILSVAMLTLLASCQGGDNKPSTPSSSEVVETFVSSATGEYEKAPFEEATELDETKISEIIEGTTSFNLTLNQVSESFDFHTKTQNEFLLGTDYDKLPAGIDGEDDDDHPLALELSWSNDIPDAKVVSKYNLYLAEDENFTDPLIYETLDTKLDLYNLKVGTHYYYKVEAKVGTKTFSSSTYSFETASHPVRNLRVDGVANCRDLGGWTTESGKKVKQGLVYRTGRLNKNRINFVQRQITQEGIKTMNEELHMKSEIDLRQRENNEVGGLKGSVLGKHVNYYNTPMEFDFDGKSNPIELKGMIKEVFTIFSEPTNLPAFFHCSIGTDRTGMIAYMLNGLLGVSKENLLKDYMFSNFGHIKDTRDTVHIKSDYVKYLDEFEGDTLSNKIENYLLSIGVTANQIASIKDTMIEK